MPLMRQNETFLTGAHDEYEEDRQRTECPQDDQALEKTNSIPDQVVLISQHNVMAQAAGKSSQDTPAQQTRGEGHNANAAPQERNKRGGYCFQG